MRSSLLNPYDLSRWSMGPASTRGSSSRKQSRTCERGWPDGIRAKHHAASVPVNGWLV